MTKSFVKICIQYHTNNLYVETIKYKLAFFRYESEDI